jgi:rod shape-determining protein MreC
MYRRSGRGRLLLLIFVALAIVVITLDFREGPGPLDRARDVSSAILAPIQRGFTAVTRPIGNFFSSLADIANLRDENTRLEEELEQAEAEIAEAKAIREENIILRGHLDLEASWLTMDRVTVSVIGRAPSNYKWAYYIDKGRNDGILPDMAVVAVEGLVGKVIEADADNAVILVLVDPAAAVRARIEDGRDPGLLRGRGADQELFLDLITTTSEVEIGDEVITAGLDNGIYPPGIPIGTVTEAGGEGAGLDRQISVLPFVDFNKLDFLEVLLETGSRVSQDGEDE